MGQARVSMLKQKVPTPLMRRHLHTWSVHLPMLLAAPYGVQGVAPTITLVRVLLRRKRMPHALHSTGLPLGPLRHWGLVSAPQWLQGPARSSRLLRLCTTVRLPAADFAVPAPAACVVRLARLRGTEWAAAAAAPGAAPVQLASMAMWANPEFACRLRRNSDSISSSASSVEAEGEPEGGQQRHKAIIVRRYRSGGEKHAFRLCTHPDTDNRDVE